MTAWKGSAVSPHSRVPATLRPLHGPHSLTFLPCGGPGLGPSGPLQRCLCPLNPDSRFPKLEPSRSPLPQVLTEGHGQLWGTAGDGCPRHRDHRHRHGLQGACALGPHARAIHATCRPRPCGWPGSPEPTPFKTPEWAGRGFTL